MSEPEQKPLEYKYIFHICGTLQGKTLLMTYYYKYVQEFRPVQ
jgi:hypothetical protein